MGGDEVAEKHGNAEGELAQKDAVSGGGGTRYREMSISLAHSSEICNYKFLDFLRKIT